MKRLVWPTFVEFVFDPTPLQIAASNVLRRFCYCRLRKARPRRADAIRGWSDCGEASAKVSVAAKTTSPRVQNRTNGSRTRLPSELELAIFTSRFVNGTLHMCRTYFVVDVWQESRGSIYLQFDHHLNFYFFSIWDAWKCTSHVVCLFARKHSKCSG